MRDSVIIRAFNDFEGQANRAIEHIDVLRAKDAAALRVFLHLKLTDRIGWLLFGAKWLTRKATR